MIWPFSRWLGRARDRRQVCESLDRMVERDVAQRHVAKMEHSAAANGAMIAVEHRGSHSTALQEVLGKVVQRQRAQDRSQ